MFMAKAARMLHSLMLKLLEVCFSVKSYFEDKTTMAAFFKKHLVFYMLLFWLSPMLVPVSVLLQCASGK